MGDLAKEKALLLILGSLRTSKETKFRCCEEQNIREAESVSLELQSLRKRRK